MGWRLELLDGGQIDLTFAGAHRPVARHRLSIYGCISTAVGMLELKGRAVDVVLYLNNQELAALAAEAAQRAQFEPTTTRGGTHGEDPK